MEEDNMLCLCDIKIRTTIIDPNKIDEMSKFKDCKLGETIIFSSYNGEKLQCKMRSKYFALNEKSLSNFIKSTFEYCTGVNEFFYADPKSGEIEFKDIPYIEVGILFFEYGYFDIYKNSDGLKIDFHITKAE